MSGRLCFKSLHVNDRCKNKQLILSVLCKDHEINTIFPKNINSFSNNYYYYYYHHYSWLLFEELKCFNFCTVKFMLLVCS